MATKKKTALRLGVGMTASLLALSACSVGTTNTSASAPAAGGGLPEVAAPAEVITQTVDALEGKKVQMVLVTDGTALTTSWIKRAQLAFEENGIDFSYSSANFDSQVLAQQVETAINQKPDLLILHNADASGLASLIKKAQQDGIYVVVMNLASNTQTDAYVGPNWDSMGAELAERTAQDCKAAGSKDVALITGFGADTGSVLFAEGATRQLEQDGMNIVATQPGQFDPSKAGAIARTLLEQHPNLCGLLGNWDVMMTGVAKVVKDAGREDKVGVYTTDSSRVTCDLISAGSMRAAINYGAGTTMGDYATAMSLYLMQSGLPAGAARTALFTPTVLIDNSNVDEPGACYDAQEVK